MADHKLNLNINLGEIQYMEAMVPDITDYKLEFITQKFQTTDPIWRTKIIKKKSIWMKFSTPRFSRSLILKLEMQKYRKILVW